MKSQFATSSPDLNRSQIATGSTHGGRRKLPMVFTEHGAIMAANVLNSPQAVKMSVFVVRAFVLMRRELISRVELEKRLLKVENILLAGKLKTNDMRAVKSIDRSEARYPAVLRKYLGIQAPDCFFGLGDLAILQEKKLALFCSVKCPGNMILQAYDLARQLRDEGIVVISGFHSSMEKECLSLLLRGKQPVIWCPARRLPAKKLRKEYAGPISDGRLLMLSPFGERIKRARQDIARFRNEFVAALADQVFIVYATPGR